MDERWEPGQTDASAALAAVHARDWSTTGLGEPASWPAEWTAALRQVLEAPLPMALIGGAALTMVANQPYRRALGDAADRGQPFAILWGEHWPHVEPHLAAALGGRGSCREDLAVEIERDGYREHASFTLCFVPCRGADGRVLGVVHTLIETTAATQASARAQMLTGELAHRLKNSMAMVHAMAQQSLRGIADRAAVEAFKDRIVALGRAHDVLLQREWASASIGSVVETMAALHGPAAARFVGGGPEIEIGPRGVLSLSMLLHELATNAAKYGALSSEAGVIEVSWTVDDPGNGAPQLALRWQERGGPPAIRSAREGFGTRLINLGLVGTRRVETTYGEDGFAASFRAPLLQLQRA